MEKNAIIFHKMNDSACGLVESALWTPSARDGSCRFMEGFALKLALNYQNI